MLLSGPEYRPAAGVSTKQAIILLHGYGADGNDLIDLAPWLARFLPETVFYSPHAPEPCEMASSGRQWFSLASYDPEIMRRNPDTMSPIYARLLEGARKAAPNLDRFIDHVAEKNQLLPARIALVGFSQGAMMALHVSLRRKAPLAGIVGFSGALIGPETLAGEINVHPPVLLVHGDGDSVVPYPAMEMAGNALLDQSVDVTTITCPGLGHGIDENGLQQAANFLCKAFGLLEQKS